MEVVSFLIGVVTTITVLLTYVYFTHPTIFAQLFKYTREQFVETRMENTGITKVLPTLERPDEIRSSSNRPLRPQLDTKLAKVDKQPVNHSIASLYSSEVTDLLSESLRQTGADGKYVTVSSMYPKDNRTADMLSRDEERKIINKFSRLVGNSFNEMNDLLKSEGKGYTVHPLYIRWDPSKMPIPRYNDHVLGVRISDEKFNYNTRTPSNDAKIMEIVDVGGIDFLDHGIIKL